MRNRYVLDSEQRDGFRRRRQALGWTMLDVAQRAGITEAALARYESLRVGYPPAVAQTIEAVLTEAERQRYNELAPRFATAGMVAAAS